MLKKGNKYKESCDLLKVSTFQSKRILDTLHHDHFLWESLLKVYSIFIQTIEDNDEDLNDSNPEKTSDKEDLHRRIKIGDIPAFMTYLAVNEDDIEYISNMCDKLIIL